MNTIYVSGQVKNDVQVKNCDSGFLFTFDLSQLQIWTDQHGVQHSKMINWHVIQSYAQEPKAILNNLHVGLEVLVKGRATIKYLECNGEVHLNCTLHGERLDILTQKELSLVAC